MDGLVRKIVVGTDYKNAMVVKEGQVVIKGKATVSYIKKNVEEQTYDVYINKTDSDELYCWKQFPMAITSVENEIDF
jgi:hypothetical protein